MKTAKALLVIGLFVLFIIGITMIAKPEPEVVPTPAPTEEGTPVIDGPKVAEEPAPAPTPKVEKKIINTTATINGREVKISWVLDSTPLLACPNVQGDFARACYSTTTNTVYVSQEIKASKELIFYHEIAHFIYTESFPKDIFKSGPFGPDYEVIANDFGWWIIGQKHPSQKSFTDEVVSKDKQDFFASTCDSACVGAILAIKIQ